MGLDMYAWKVAKNDGNEMFSIPEEVERIELAYWRKFNALHGWMERIYMLEGGSKTFNCIPLQLSPALIDRLETELGILEPVEGFFFGEQTIYPEDIEDTKKFIADARQAFADGFDVYYDSWW